MTDHFPTRWTRAGRKASALAAILLLALTAAGCNDSGTEPDDDEPNVATMRLTVGQQTINVNARTGAVTGGPIVIPVGNTAVSAQFLLDNGQPDPVATSASFRLDVDPANTQVVTFARTSAFAGTLQGLQAGSTTILFGLFHLGEGHEEFEWPVPVQVQ
jgi:hypothetical protein